MYRKIGTVKENVNKDIFNNASRHFQRNTVPGRWKRVDSMEESAFWSSLRVYSFIMIWITQEFVPSDTLPTPATPRRVTGPWRVVTSLRPVTSSTPITTAWSMAFRSLGPGRHWAIVRPGFSHHRHAGWMGLLVTGPGRPARRVCLGSLGRWRGGWVRSLRRVLLPGRPVILGFDGWNLKSLFWCVDFNRVVHLLAFLRCLSCRRLAFPLLLNCSLHCLPRFEQPVLAQITRSVLCAKSQTLNEAALLTLEVVIALSSVVRATQKLHLRFRGRWCFIASVVIMNYVCKWSPWVLLFKPTQSETVCYISCKISCVYVHRMTYLCTHPRTHTHTYIYIYSKYV